MAVRSGTGGKGRSFNDRELAAQVRTLAMRQVYAVLQGEGLGEDKEFKKALLLKLAPNILPRLNELSGPDGTPIPLLYGVSNNESNAKDIQIEE